MLLGAMVRAIRDKSLLQVQADVHTSSRPPVHPRTDTLDSSLLPAEGTASVLRTYFHPLPTETSIPSRVIDRPSQTIGIPPRDTSTSGENHAENSQSPQVALLHTLPPRVATPLPPNDWTTAPFEPSLMPDIPDTMQEEWYKDKARIVEVDPDIQSSIQEIEDLTKDLQLDMDDNDGAFKMLRDRNAGTQPTGNFRSNKTFGDRLFSTTGFEPRRYSQTTSRERVPPIMLQRRASVPRINVSRATCRKPTSQPRKTLANLLPPSTAYVFRVGGNGVHMKSSKTVLEKLRLNRAPILLNNLMRSTENYTARFDQSRRHGRTDPAQDDLDIDKFVRANNQQGSAGSSGSRFSLLSTPENQSESPNLRGFMTAVTSSSLSSTTSKSSASKPVNRDFGPAYDDADELILKDIEQEYL
ncbi:uncharacterized protein LOC111261325 isoform X2 [Varroa jacobsoni]|uniref:uncharacterized protein LOC111261325 isoform X2 n=1 Tax=Varroa jacobsoni TaxID=62625 RepID=UPI000BF9D6E9|nr:uncharacterized protein LOC111261325 isoform X2 [Varroa jacobsoni]XP_022690461.1 uncharacterized protein LOC111261325 isoform X2 [Varroa jacobsoni]